MATASSSTSLSGSRRLWPRVAAWFLLVLLLVLAGICFWAYSVARGALPQLDGTLKVAGLANRVVVTRDGHGVPTIDSASLDDLFFAQGYVTAQDRLWQMDATRRYAGGDLAEVVGPDALKHDRQQRVFGIRLAARKAVEVSSPQVMAQFQAYARGVNAYIASRQNNLPVEFRILRYTPKPWTPEDSYLVGAQMAQLLSTTPREALMREKILAKLGPELTADLFVNSSWHDRPPTVMPASLEVEQKDKNKDDKDDDDEGNDSGSSVTWRFPSVVPSQLEFDALDAEFAPGSNNWVVSGAHTVTGKPLLCNDMHLGQQIPGVWYEAHLRAGDYDVAGVTLPGVPYVIVGHNQRIAWGFTNLGPAVEDAYVETLDGSGQYLTPQGWKAPEKRQEVIHVKGKPDVVFEVRTTRHGPLVTDLIAGETRAIALRWTLYDGIHNPFFAVNSAQNWEQFRQAFSGFDAPAQNVVYADVDGNIGYQATGKIPIRASGDGSLPENGSDDQHEWTSYVPFDKLPSIYNPPSGILATANARITPDNYAYSLSNEWEAPWRAARIYRLLESGRKFSATDMIGLQTDVYSELDRFFAERFVYSVDHAKSPSARSKQAADILRQWDGRMTASSAAPNIEWHARTELMRLLLEPKLGAAAKDSQDDDDSGELNWETYRRGMQSVWAENVILHQPRRWLPDSYPNYDELLAAAVEAAVKLPEASANLETWRWGNFDAIELQHPMLGKIPFLNRWTGPGVQPQSGSGLTVKAVTAKHGPSERFTANLADLDSSTLNVVTGQGGNFLSPYYMDQWQAWYQGFTFVLPFSREAVEKARAHQLVLVPNSP